MSQKKDVTNMKTQKTEIFELVCLHGVHSLSLWCTSELGRRERFRVFASPTQKHFDNAKREDAQPLQMTRSRKTRRATDVKFCVTGVSDIS